MENDESNYFNLITYENNEDDNNSISEELDINKNHISKSDHLRHSNKKVISEKIKKDYSLENMIFKENKYIINNDSITNSNKKELADNNYESKTFNIEIDNKNKKNLKYEINSINLILDSSTNNEIKECGKEKNKNYENKSFASLKINSMKNPKLFKSLRQSKKTLDNSLTKRRITISSDRNPSKLKVITNYNSTYYRNNNTQIYNNGINNNKKKIFSSLKRKSNTPKMKNSCSSVCENKSPKIANKKRYNSSQHNSSKNENVNETNKNNSKTYDDLDDNLNNINEMKKDSLNANDSRKSRQSSFIRYNSKCNKILSPKEQIIEDKIQELNNETQKFREERQKVNELKKEYEKLQTKLLKDIEDFLKKKEEFEKFKQNEINNLNKERKNMLLDNKYISNARNQNKSLESEIKKNEEIIAKQKTQINELKLIIKNKDIEIKNLNRIIREIKIDKKETSINKLKETKNESDNINNHNISKLSKKHNSTKILTINSNNNKDKCDFVPNSKFFKLKKINILKGDKNNISFNDNSILGQNKESKLFINKKNKSINNISYTSNNSNRVSNISSELFNSSFIKNIRKANKNDDIKSKAIYNINDNSNSVNSKNESVEPIKIPISMNNSTIQNYKNKNLIRKYYINPVQCKLKKNLKGSFTKKPESNNKISYKKIYDSSSQDYNNEIEMINPNKSNRNTKANNTVRNKESHAKNDNYDFIIPEKYQEIDKNNNKIIKTLNINGNIISIYSNNKKEITYPDGIRQIIYDDSHQIIFYKNGDIKQIFNNGKTVFLNKKEQKIETLYQNGIKIVKYNNGKMERFLFDDKENIISNNVNK